MSRKVMSCPVCKHEESVISTRPGSENPPCPRCEDAVRMEDVTPSSNQKTTWSTAGSQADAKAVTPDSTPETTDHGWGPSPRGG